jgi:hypothetical protein
MKENLTVMKLIIEGEEDGEIVRYTIICLINMTKQQGFLNG